MNCKQCGSERVASVQGHCVDRFTIEMGDREYGPDYVPHDIGIGGGDDIEFDYCLSCGQIQGDFPITPAFTENDEEDE